jgi:hypothetical protein
MTYYDVAVGCSSSDVTSGALQVEGPASFVSQFSVMFIDSFMDDVTYVKDVEVCVERMICYIPGCICCGSENFGLGFLHDDYVGLTGTTSLFYSVAPYRFDYRFVDEKFVFCR